MFAPMQRIEAARRFSGRLDTPQVRLDSTAHRKTDTVTEHWPAGGLDPFERSRVQLPTASRRRKPDGLWLDFDDVNEISDLRPDEIDSPERNQAHPEFEPGPAH